MRIVHYHPALRVQLGGVVRAVLDIGSVMAGAGHDVTLLTGDADDDLDDAYPEGAARPRVVRLDDPFRRGGRLSSRAARAVESALDDADVLHLHGLWSLDRVRVAGLARRRGRPYVASTHGMFGAWSMAQSGGRKKRLYLALFGRRMMYGAGVVHFTAREEMEQARRWIPRADGVVVPLPIDFSAFDPAPGPSLALERHPSIAGDRVRILFLSRLHPGKRVELVLDALRTLRDGGQRYTFVVAGRGDEDYERALRDHARRIGLADDVHFLGFLSGEEKISLYEASDLFVLPSEHENFGLVLCESLAAGTPVITTRGTAPWAELEQGGGAVIVEPEADAIAGAIAGLAGDAARRERMGRAGQAWVRGTLSHAALTPHYEALYDRAVTASEGTAKHA